MPLEITGSRRAWRAGPLMTTSPSVLRRGLRLVALRPFGEDAVAVLGHPGEVVLTHRWPGVGRIIRRKILHRRFGHERIVLRVEFARRLARAPVCDLLGDFEVLRALDDAGRLHVPAGAFLRQDDVDRRALALLARAAHIEADAGHALALRGLDARRGAGMRIDRDVLVQPVHELPAVRLTHDLQPGRNGEIAGAG